MLRPRLLLADDSITIQKVVNLTFADEGIDVVTVGDGDSALDHLNQFVPDVVLADVHMPGLGGYELCQKIREAEVTRNVPVVLLVGSFEPFDQDEANRVGANAFLTKPFQSIRQLVTQVTELIEARSGKPEAAAPPVPTDEAEPAIETQPESVVAAESESAVEASTTAEFEPESRPTPTSEQADDIESLYSKSVAETVELPGRVQQFARYDDSGLDDEMIETSYAGDASDDRVDLEVPEVVTEEFRREPEYANATVEQSSSLSEGDSADRAGIEEQTGRSESGVRDGQGYSEPSWRPAEQLHSDIEESSQIEAAVNGPETETASAPAADSSETQSESPTGIDRSPWGSPVGAETLRLEPLTSMTTTPEIEFDQMDLLEIPPIAEGTSYQLTTPTGALDAGSKTQVVSLSPELLDLIVRKVVEKLSEKY